MEIKVKLFSELSVKTLYEILKLRSDIFVVEQECPYSDMDGNDCDAIHLYVEEGENIAAYCRILKKGVTFPKAAIGRVVVGREYRGKGLARELMEYAMRYVCEELGESSIMLSGQSYLKAFYESLGFKAVSDEYLEDGIPHYDMLYSRSEAES